MPADAKKISLDCIGLQCPGPIVKVYDAINSMNDGDTLEVSASDPGFVRDIGAWCQTTGNTLISAGKEGNEYKAVLMKGLTGGPAAAETGSTVVPGRTDMLSKKPHLREMWDYGRNEGLDPTCIMTSDLREAYWICPICGRSFLRPYLFSSGKVNPLSPAKPQQPTPSGMNTLLEHSFARAIISLSTPIWRVEHVRCSAIRLSVG
jgi:TusA-related sulfurtransferase